MTFYEIEIDNAPVISIENIYPTLTLYGVEKSYAKATIKYFPTSIQCLYKIGEEEWREYNGETIRLEIGETIYAKGIDESGNETNSISSYTATIPADAIGSAAYDGDDATYVSYRALSSSNPIKRKMNIDSATYEKQVRLKFNARRYTYIYFILQDETKQEICNTANANSGSVNKFYTIPNNAKELWIESRSGALVNGVTFYEIEI